MQESSASPPSTALAPQAFSELLVNTQRPLFAFVAGLVGDRELARDIVQDVFCDAWLALQRGAAPFEAPFEQAAVRRWLFHAAYCDAATALKRGSLIVWESINAGNLPESLSLERERHFEDTVAERLALDAALSKLKPVDAACLLLNALQGFTALEIGQIIGVSAEASKKRLARAKRRLRDTYTSLNRKDEGLRP